MQTRPRLIRYPDGLCVGFAVLGSPLPCGRWHWIAACSLLGRSLEVGSASSLSDSRAIGSGVLARSITIAAPSARTRSVTYPRSHPRHAEQRDTVSKRHHHRAAAGVRDSSRRSRHECAMGRLIVSLDVVGTTDLRPSEGWPTVQHGRSSPAYPTPPWFGLAWRSRTGCRG